MEAPKSETLEFERWKQKFKEKKNGPQIRKRENKHHTEKIEMEIKTKLHVQDEEDEQPLSPAARLFHTREFNLNIISVIGLKSKINSDMIIRGFKESCIKHPRFSSRLVSLNIL